MVILYVVRLTQNAVNLSVNPDILSAYSLILDMTTIL